MRPLLSLALLSALLAPARAEKGKPIFNGVPVGSATALERAIKASTVQLVVLWPDDAVSVCTAVVLNSAGLLTAAHCVKGAKSIHAWLSAASPVDVEMYGVHKDYRRLAGSGKANEHDLAVLPIAGTLPAGRAAAPRDFAARPAAGETLWLAGYGTTTPAAGSKTGVGLLRMAAVPVKASADSITVDQTERGACTGDSGGPAFGLNSKKEPYLAGVIFSGSYPYCDDQAVIDPAKDLDFARGFVYYGKINGAFTLMPETASR